MVNPQIHSEDLSPLANLCVTGLSDVVLLAWSGIAQCWSYDIIEMSLYNSMVLLSHDLT